MVSRIPYTLRLLRRCPGLILAAFLLFTACITVNVAVFSLVSSMLFAPLPCYRDPGRLVTLWSVRAGENRYPFTTAEYLDYANRTSTLAQVAAFCVRGASARTAGGNIWLMGARASASFFDMTGVHAALGRVLLPADELPGHPRVVLISTRTWERIFHADPKAPGRVLRLDSDEYIVVGVLPNSFMLPDLALDYMTPLGPLPTGAVHNSANYLRLMGRLKPGVTIEQASVDVNAIAARLKEEFPNANPEKTGVQLTLLRDAILGNGRVRLLGLLGAVAALLVIAAVNMAGTLVVRSWEWRRDLALLAAMGTNPERLMLQFLLQTIAIGLLAGICGTALATFRAADVQAFLPLPAPLPMSWQHPSLLDGRVLLFALAISLASGMIFGMPAALYAARIRGTRSLSMALAGSAQTRGGGGRRLLVIAQVAACLVLVIGTGLLLRSLLRLEIVRPGFNPDHLLTFRITPPPLKYRDAADAVELHERVLRRLAGPPVLAAGASSSLPLRKMSGMVDISAADGAHERVLGVPYQFVDETYFDAMQIPIVSGRGFSLRDGPRSQAVAIVSRGLAYHLGGPGDGIGAHLEIDDANGEPRDVEVVGVAGDVHQKRLGEEHAQTLYVPLRQLPPAAAAFFGLGMNWVVRTQGPPMDAVAAVSERILPVTSDSVVTDFVPMETFVRREIAQQRRNVWIAAGFAAAILGLATLGLYAAISHFVCRQAREIGVRMVLGARSREILLHVIAEGLSLTMIGAIFGLGAVFVLAQLLSTLLFEVPVFDPLTIGCATLLLLSVAVLAASLPALRATKVDPILTLRQE